MRMGVLVITAAMVYSSQNWTLGEGIPGYPHRKAWVDSNWYLFPYCRATPRHMAGTRWGLSHPLLLILFLLTKSDDLSSDVPSTVILCSPISRSQLRLSVSAALFLVHMQWRSCWEPTLPLPHPPTLPGYAAGTGYSPGQWHAARKTCWDHQPVCQVSWETWSSHCLYAWVYRNVLCYISYNKIQVIVFTVNCKLEIVMVMNAEKGEILDPRPSKLKPEVFATKRPVDPDRNLCGGTSHSVTIVRVVLSSCN